MQNYLTLRDGRKILLNSPEGEAEINAGIAADPDTFELDAAWFARARPASEVLPGLVGEKMARAMLKPRGKQVAPTKQAVTVRYSPDVLAAFKATGAGWQTRMNDALRDWLKTHSPV
jgi:uncharacterized protein (DUF4415 family)